MGIWSGARTALIVVALVGCTARTQPTRREGPPNVAIIILDTLRADRLGGSGTDLPAGLSPELDALRADAVDYRNCVSTTSWTRPSIGSMLTGLHPRTLGIYGERGDALRDEFTTLPEILHENGYRTLGVTANPNINTTFNFHQGFDEYVDSTVVWDWMQTRPGQTRAVGKVHLVAAAEMFAKGLELVEGSDGPTYLQVDVMDVHEWARGRGVVREEFTGLYKGRPDAPYLRTVRQVSADTGAFVETLRERPGWEDALIVVTSDHGEGLFDHPGVERSRFHGGLLYSSQLRVPFFLQGPRLPRGKRVETLVSGLDLTPTVLDYLGLAAPNGMAGVSVLPLATDTPGEVTTRRQRFVVETQFRDWDKIGVVTPEWTFVHNNGSPHAGHGETELQAFGSPENGVATDRSADHPEVVEELSALIATWRVAHPALPRWEPEGGGMTEAEVEQLRALGYLE